MNSMRGFRAITESVNRRSRRPVLVSIGLLGGVAWHGATIQRATWTLASSPSLELKSFGDSAPLVRVVGATLLRSGEIIVADEALLRVMLFSKDGKSLVSLGGRGTQPGKFQSMGWLGQCARDTIYIHDPVQNRVTTVDANGNLNGVHSATFKGQPVAIPYTLHCARNGAFGLIGWPEAMPPGEPGPHRRTVTVAAAPRLGAKQTELSVLPSPERYRPERTEGHRPLGKTISMALSTTRLFVGTADSFTVQVFDNRGMRQEIIGRNVARRPLTQADKITFIEQSISNLRDGQQRQELRASRTALRYPEYFPAYRRFLVDSRNRLWVEQYPVPTDSSRQWWVFLETGQAGGLLVVPAQFDVLEIEDTYALGTWTDEDGKESVRLYPVSRQ